MKNNLVGRKGRREQGYQLLSIKRDVNHDDSL